MAQVSLAWCMAKEPVTAPIIGTTSLSNLEDILGKYSVTRAWSFGLYIHNPITPPMVE